jgi:hypothetical protein
VINEYLTGIAESKQKKTEEISVFVALMNSSPTIFKHPRGQQNICFTLLSFTNKFFIIVICSIDYNL